MIRRRTLIVVAVSVLIAIGTPATALYWLCYTQSGLQWLAGRTARLKNVQVRIDGLRGTLAGSIDASRIEIVHERAHIVATGVHARPLLRKLLLQTLEAQEMRAANVQVQLKRKTTPPSGRPPRFLPITWLTLRADAIELGPTQVTLQNGQQLYAARSVIGAGLTHRKLRLDDVRLSSDQLACTGSGELRAAVSMGISGDVSCVAQLPQQPRYAGRVRLDGDLNRLNLKGNLTAPLQATVNGALRDLTKQWTWEARAIAADANLKPWQPESNLGNFAVNFSGSGDRERLRLTGRVEPQSLPTGPVDVSLSGTFAKRRLQAEPLELRFAANGGMLTAAGEFLFDGGPPTIELRGRWSRFAWPATAPVVVSRNGELTLSGPLPYAYTADGTLSGKQLPPSNFQSTGSIDRDVIVFSTLQAQLIGPLGSPLAKAPARRYGTVGATGRFSWKDDKPWQVKADAKQIDPTFINKAFPGNVSFTLTASGHGFEPAGPWQIELTQLQGKLRAQDLSGRAKVSRNADTWELDNVRLTYGAALLEAHGRYAETSNLRWRLVADDLSKVLPEARGKLNFGGHLSGTNQQPRLTASLNGSGLEYRRYRADSIAGTAGLDLTDRTASELQLIATKIGFADRQLRSAEISLYGRSSDHELHIQADASQVKVALAANGGYAPRQWQGELTQATVDSGAEHTALQAPTPVFVSARRVDIEPFCLIGNPQRVCGNAHWQADGAWSGKLDATSVPLRMLAAGLAQPAEYSGLLAIDAAAAGQPGRPWTGAIKLGFTEGLFVYTRGSGKKDRFSIGSGQAELTAAPEHFTATVNLNAGEVASITGQAAADRLPAGSGSPNPWRQYPLSGSLRARTRELGFIPLLVPEIDRASGDFSAALTIAGTLGAPQFEGGLALEKGEMDLYAVNLLLRDIGLRVDLKGNTLALSAHTRAGEGSAEVSGELAWNNSAPKGAFKLKGENLAVANVPEARVHASPSIRLSIDGRNIEVDGAVRVPYARLKPANLTGAVLPSQDEVLVGAQPQDPNKRFHVLTGIHLILGKDVRIDSYGLSGKLTGSIAAYTETDEVSTGTGELQVMDGKYVAYGRELDIERGRLIFTGGDLSNPGVDIRAVKQFPQGLAGAPVLAGVNVRGTLRDPRISFFSDPPLPQTQIASLLVTGRTFLQDGTGSSMSRERLLAQGGALLAKQLGGPMGIDDVSVESTGTDSSSLVLGKYLSPRLYVGYGISLAESINTLKLRYTLGDRWTIKMEAGEYRSADVVYSIEK